MILHCAWWAVNAQFTHSCWPSVWSVKEVSTWASRQASSPKSSRKSFTSSLKSIQTNRKSRVATLEFAALIQVPVTAVQYRYCNCTEATVNYFGLPLSDSSPLSRGASSRTVGLTESQMMWLSLDADTTNSPSTSIKCWDTSQISTSLCCTITGLLSNLPAPLCHCAGKSFCCVLSLSESATSAQQASHSLLYPLTAEMSSSDSQSEHGSGSLQARDWTEWADGDRERPGADSLSSLSVNCCANSFSTPATSSAYAARAFSVSSRSLKKCS